MSVTVTILSNGSPIKQEYGLQYVDIIHECNRLSYAELCFEGGDMARQEFSLSESALFEPGQKLEIKLRDEGRRESEKTVFAGTVVKQGLKFGAAGTVLLVEAYHEAIKMTSLRQSARYENQTDADVINKLLAKNGLQAGTVDSSKTTHENLVQYYTSDWDFMLSRAEANGLFITLQTKTVSAIAPKVSNAPVKTFRVGIDEVYSFEAEADARGQRTAVESMGWDVKKQKPEFSNASDIKLAPGNFSAQKLSKAVGGDKESLVSAVTLNKDEAKAWADGAMIKSRLAMVKGRISVMGTAAATTGDTIKLEGVGSRFSGNVWISGVRHRVTTNDWTTDIQFGLSADRFSASPGIIDTKAAGLLPGINGLQIGKVHGYAEDKEKEHRVKVIVPALNSTNEEFVWARLTSPDAGKNRGLVFWPEPDDEVILGFLNDDPRQAVILGAVYSSANEPPLPAEEKNPAKGIVTREGLQVLFDDEEKTVRILTSDKNVITVNEKDKFIQIEDVNKNSILLDANGITLDSAKDVVVKSKGNLQFQAKGNVEIKGSKIDIS